MSEDKKKQKFKFQLHFRNWSDPGRAIFETIEMVYNQILPIIATFLVLNGNWMGFILFVPLIINLRFDKNEKIKK